MIPRDAAAQNEPPELLVAIDDGDLARVEALLDAGAQFRMFKKLILELRGQYRFVGSTEAGPLQFESRTLPRTSVDFSHAFLGIGIGLAFR